MKNSHIEFCVCGLCTRAHRTGDFSQFHSSSRPGKRRTIVADPRQRSRNCIIAVAKVGECECRKGGAAWCAYIASVTLRHLDGILGTTRCTSSGWRRLNIYWKSSNSAFCFIQNPTKRSEDIINKGRTSATAMARRLDLIRYFS